MKKLTTIAVIFVALSVLLSCTKEGEGGTGTIQGKVFKVLHDDDNFTLSADTMVAAKQDVFIVYGDDVIYGDDTETGDDGLYRFQYLMPGEYTVYAYSELPSGEKVAVKQEVTLKRGETLNVADIYVHDGKAYGTSMIRGQVWATYFDKNGDLGTQEAYEQRVYLMRLGEQYHFEDTRVGYNGYYYFQKLQPDTYVVVTYGEDANELPVPVYDTVVVDESGRIYDAAPLSIRLKA